MALLYIRSPVIGHISLARDDTDMILMQYTINGSSGQLLHSAATALHNLRCLAEWHQVISTGRAAVLIDGAIIIKSSCLVDRYIGGLAASSRVQQLNICHD